MLCIALTVMFLCPSVRLSHAGLRHASKRLFFRRIIFVFSELIDVAKLRRGHRQRRRNENVPFSVASKSIRPDNGLTMQCHCQTIDRTYYWMQTVTLSCRWRSFSDPYVLHFAYLQYLWNGRNTACMQNCRLSRQSDWRWNYSTLGVAWVTWPFKIFTHLHVRNGWRRDVSVSKVSDEQIELILWSCPLAYLDWKWVRQKLKYSALAGTNRRSVGQQWTEAGGCFLCNIWKCCWFVLRQWYYLRNLNRSWRELCQNPHQSSVKWDCICETVSVSSSSCSAVRGLWRRGIKISWECLRWPCNLDCAT